jgi:hypothetical protein
MPTYAVLDGGQVVARRQIDDFAAYPEHKRAANDERGDGGPVLRIIEEEGSGPNESLVIEANRVRLVRSAAPLVADHVRAEAQRRIIALVGATSLDGCLIKQLNASMRATELVNKRSLGQALSDAEEAEAAALQTMADAIKLIRARSNAMEGSPPADYRDDARWI